MSAKTDDEIRQLALDWIGNKIYSNRHVPDGMRIEEVFIGNGGALSGLRTLGTGQ